MRIRRTRVLHDLTEIVGNIFDRDSGKRKYYVNLRGCYIWCGFCDDDGYGQVSYKHKTTRAARFVYTRVNGLIPEGEVVRHTCDTSSCINPAHLITGTQNDNIQDKVAKGRQSRRANHYRAKITEEDVTTIRRLYAGGMRQVDIAPLFGIVQTQVSNIVLHKTWR